MKVGSTQRNLETLLEVLTTKEALAALQAMVRLERPYDSDLISQADELLRALPDETAAPDLIQGLLDVQELYYAQLLCRNARPASLKAVRWARQIQDQKLLAKALNYRGAIASFNYDLSTALESLLEALQIGVATNDTFRMAVSYLNLAPVMGFVGRYRAVVACAEAAIELARTPGYEQLHAQALTALSDFHQKQCDWRAALKFTREARCMLESNSASNPVSYALSLENEALALLWLGEFEHADAVADRLTEVAKQHPSELIKSYVRFVTATREGFVGDLQCAASMLRDFTRLPHARDEALSTLIALYERAGEPERALEATRELMDGLRSARREVTEADIAQIAAFVPGRDDSVMQDLATRAAGLEKVVDRIGDKFRAKLAYLFELGANAELPEEDTQFSGEHIYRVGRLCASLSAEASYGDEMCWLAEIAGRAHDVGKTSVPSFITQKIVPLTDGERDILRTHAEDGAALIAQLAEPRLVQVVAAVRHHHERWDGAGYPSALKGEEIPLLARIVALCDSFDSMTHSRPFRPARSVTSGLQEVERCAGSQFDPRLAGLFVNLVRRLQREHGDLDEYLGEPARRTRWAKSHPELMRLLEARRTTL